MHLTSPPPFLQNPGFVVEVALDQGRHFRKRYVAVGFGNAVDFAAEFVVEPRFFVFEGES